MALYVDCGKYLSLQNGCIPTTQSQAIRSKVTFVQILISWRP